MKKFVFSILFLTIFFCGFSQEETEKDSVQTAKSSQWYGKRVAFLGDSMTQKSAIPGYVVFWEYLAEMLGLKPFVYGISGNQWNGILKQAEKLNVERGQDIDAIIIFAGTNDYNHGIPIGEFFSETTKETNHNGKTVLRKYRTPIYNDSTFCGRINKVMSFLKDRYPKQQIIIMTPVHRGFAGFSDKNVQPEESFANGQGLYLDAYVEKLKQASLIWAVPLIDLYSVSGLYPMSDSHVPYFRNAKTDRLHLNATGNLRLAESIKYQLLAFPAHF